MRLISDDALAVITIYQEAAGEPWDGKVAVAEVIRNRMNDKYMSDGTVSGTVLRAYQFSGWNTDAGAVRLKSLRIDSDDPVVMDCRKAWTAAQQQSNLVKGAVLYLNPQTVMKRAGRLPTWAASTNNPMTLNAARVVATIGRHVFLVD